MLTATITNPLPVRGAGHPWFATAIQGHTAGIEGVASTTQRIDRRRFECMHASEQIELEAASVCKWLWLPILAGILLAKLFR